jgi:hypothetical protein
MRLGLDGAYRFFGPHGRKCGYVLAAVLSLGLTACGGGGGDSSAIYSIGGTVTGLDGTLVLQNNGGNPVTVEGDTNGNTSFLFPRLPQGATYEVTIRGAQPRGQTCTVENGSGTIRTTVRDIRVICDDNTYALGGTISGLIGSAQVVLQNNGADPLTLSSNGGFTFATPVPHGEDYAVTVRTQPGGGLACVVENGSGTIDAAPVDDIAVSCGQDPNLVLEVDSVKRFTFTWFDLEKDSYALYEDLNDGKGSNLVATFVPGDPAFDSREYTMEVFLPARINASYILEFCEGTVCEDSVPVQVSGTLTEAVGYVKASNTRANSQFGTRVALSADAGTLAVGAPFENSNGDGTFTSPGPGLPNSGAVYVFTRTDPGVWAPQAMLKASNAGGGSSADGDSGDSGGDEFGFSLALSADGDTLAVSALREDSNATGIYQTLPHGAEDNNSAPNAGAVYVFTRSDEDWTQQAYIKASNAGERDEFGFSVSLDASGDVLAVGAHLEDGNGIAESDDSLSGSGAVYLFARDGVGAWSQTAYRKASNPGSNDQFGNAVALSADGSTLAVGARQESGVGDFAPNSGAVYIYTFDGTVWDGTPAYIKAANADAGDQFGYSVALSGDGSVLAVGAWSEDGAVAGIDGDPSSNLAPESGAVYVFAREGVNWTQDAYIKASNPNGTVPAADGFSVGDSFGYAVALSDAGDVLAVGAWAEDSAAAGLGGNQASNALSNSGAAYVFRRSDGEWRQEAYVKASNPGNSDAFGDNLALSGDGETLAVGAPLEDGNATGVGGAVNNSAVRSGAVYLY